MVMKETIFKWFVITFLFISLLSGCREDNPVKPYLTPINEYDLTYRVIEPVFGTNWAIGSSNTIKWTPIYGVSKINILLYKKSEFISVIAERISNDGKFTWTIPELPYQSHHYIIKIVQPGSENVLLESEHFYVLN